MPPTSKIRASFNLNHAKPNCALQVQSKSEGVSMIVNGQAFALTSAEAIEIANTLVDAAESGDGA